MIYKLQSKRITYIEADSEDEAEELFDGDEYVQDYIVITSIEEIGEVQFVEEIGKLGVAGDEMSI